MSKAFSVRHTFHNAAEDAGNGAVLDVQGSRAWHSGELRGRCQRQPAALRLNQHQPVGQRQPFRVAEPQPIGQRVTVRVAEPEPIGVGQRVAAGSASPNRRECPRRLRRPRRRPAPRAMRVL